MGERKDDKVKYWCPAGAYLSYTFLREMLVQKMALACSEGDIFWPSEVKHSWSPS